MTKSTIVDKDAPILRKQAKVVPIKDISSKKIQSVLKRMKTALKREDDGVAIAAPQINEGFRIFIMSGRIPSIIDKEAPITEDKVFINPEIIKISKKKTLMEEGCLSVRWLYGKVLRADKVTIRAYDEHGKKFERGATGLVSQIFQHEVDHLNGILFIDKAKDLENLPPAPPKKRKK